MSRTLYGWGLACSMASPPRLWRPGDSTIAPLRKLLDARTHGTSTDLKLSEGHGKGEAPRACAARIHIEDAVLLLHHGLVRMAADHDPEAGQRGPVQIGDLVHDVDADLIHCQAGRARHGGGPAAAIVVAAHRSNWRELVQLVEDRRVADVAGMHDAIAS